MIDELLTDAERRRLLELAIAAVPWAHGDRELTAIIAKLSGTDTVLIARRAYRSSFSERLVEAGAAEIRDGRVYDTREITG